MTSGRVVVGLALTSLLLAVGNARAAGTERRQAGRLELTAEAASKLEKLTREHLGGKVAFVIDGEPVTLHKIRGVITGGEFRISRCTDTACQYIYSRLVGSRQGPPNPVFGRRTR